MPDDKLKILYDNLIRTGKITQKEMGDFSTFSKLMSDSTNVRTFYNNITSSGVVSPQETGDFDTFYGYIKSNPQPKEPELDFKKNFAQLDSIQSNINQQINDYILSSPTPDASGTYQFKSPADLRNDETYQQLERKKNYVTHAKDLLTSSQKFLEGKDDGGQFFKGLTSPLAKDFFTAGLTEMGRNFDIVGVARKAGEGKELTEDEQALLAAYGAYQSTMSQPGGFGYTVGQQLAMQVPYMVQFALTGGIGTAAEGGVNALLHVTKASLPKLMKDQGYKAVLRQVGKELPGLAVKGASQTPFMPMTYSIMGEKLIGEVSPEGEIISQPTLSEGIWKGLANAYPEVLTESMGAHIMGTLGAAGRSIGKKIPAGLTRLLTPVEKIRKATAFSSIPEEFSEEMLNNVITPLIDPDTDFKDVWTAQNILTTLFTVSTTGGAFYATNQAYKAIDENMLRAKYLSGLPKDIRTNVIGSLKSDDPKEISQKLSDIISSSGVQSQQAKGILDYAWAETMRKGMAESLFEQSKDIQKRQIEREITNQIAPFVYKDGETLFQVLDRAGNVFWVKDGEINVNKENQSWSIGNKPLIVIPMDGSEPRMMAATDVNSVRTSNIYDRIQKEIDEFDLQSETEKTVTDAAEIAETEKAEAEIPNLKTGDYVLYNGREAVISTVSGKSIDAQFTDNEQPVIIPPQEYKNLQKVDKTISRKPDENDAKTQNNVKVLKARVGENDVDIKFTPNVQNKALFTSDNSFLQESDADKVIKSLSDRYSQLDFTAVDVNTDPFSANNFVIQATPKISKPAETKLNEIDAKRADIERRRQIDLTDGKLYKWPGTEHTTIPEESWTKVIMKDINNKYDAELQQLNQQNGEQTNENEQKIQQEVGKETVVQPEEVGKEEKLLTPQVEPPKPEMEEPVIADAKTEQQTPYEKFTTDLGLNEPFEAIRGNAKTGKIGNVDVVVYDKDDNVAIESIYAPIDQRKQGGATRAMEALTAKADELGVNLELRAVPSKDTDMKPQQLRDWYRKFGFSFIGNNGLRVANEDNVRPATESAESKTISDVPKKVGGKENQAWEMTMDEYYQTNYLPKLETALKSITIEEVPSLTGGKSTFVYHVNGRRSDFAYRTRQEAENKAKDEANNLFSLDNAKNNHLFEVAKALSERKPVPGNVLSEYPDLNQQSQKTDKVSVGILKEQIKEADAQVDTGTNDNYKGTPEPVVEKSKSNKETAEFAGEIIKPKSKAKNLDKKKRATPKRIKDVIRDPQSFEESVLQFLVAGGRFNANDFIRYTGFKAGSKEYRIASLFALSGKGLSFDDFYESNESFGMENGGAMDMINAITDIILRNTSKWSITSRLEELQNENAQPPDHMIDPDFTPEDVEIESSDISTTFALSNDPDINSVIEDYGGEEADWASLLSEIETDPGVFTVFPYGLKPEQLAELKKIISDELQRKTTGDQKVSQTEGEDKRNDRTAGTQDDGGRVPKETLSKDETARQREINSIISYYDKGIADLKKTLISDAQLRNRQNLALKASNKKINLFGQEGPTGEQDLFAGEGAFGTDATEIRKSISDQVEAFNRQVNKDIAILERSKSAEIDLIEKQSELGLGVVDAKPAIKPGDVVKWRDTSGNNMIGLITNFESIPDVNGFKISFRIYNTTEGNGGFETTLWLANSSPNIAKGFVGTKDEYKEWEKITGSKITSFKTNNIVPEIYQFKNMKDRLGIGDQNNLRFQLQPSGDITDDFRNAEKQGVPLFQLQQNPLFSKDAEFIGDVIFGKNWDGFIEFHNTLTEIAKRVSEQTGTKIIVVKSAGELPNYLKEEVVRKNKQGKFSPALFVEKKNGTKEVWVISNQSRSTTEAGKTLMHEVVAHHGLRQLFGEKYDNILREVWVQMPESEKRRLAGLYDSHDRLLIADEWLAKQAETLGDKTPSWIRKVFSQIRQLLRDTIGLNLQFTDNDLKAMFTASRDNLAKEASKKPVTGKFAGEVIFDVETLRQAMTLYHGTPHDFDKFSSDKIGTGEGAQAYGYGLYFTDVKDIAEYYANKLAFDEAITKNYGLIIDGKFANGYRSGDFMIDQAIYRVHTQQTKEDAIKTLKGITFNPDLTKVQLQKAQKAVNDAIKIIEDAEVSFKSAKIVITATIHKGKEADQYDYLRWDKPVTDEQIDKVKTVFDDIVNKETDYHRASKLSSHFNSFDFENKTGEDVYKIISKAILGNPYIPKGNSDQLTSAALLNAGIDGIKYPAESRGDNARGFNYVVFDENAIEIEDKLRFQIIGENGLENLNRANMGIRRAEKLIQAKAMESTNAPKDFIQNATGWFKGKDGLWRTELNDRKTKLLTAIDNITRLPAQDNIYTKEIPLTDVIDNRELLTATPELKDYKIVFYNYDGNNSATASESFVDFDKRIVGVAISPTKPIISLQERRGRPTVGFGINRNGGVSQDDPLKSNILHEVQHIVQRHSGFAVGGNAESVWQNAIRNEKERMAGLAEYKSLPDGEAKQRFVEGNIIARMGVSTASQAKAELYRHSAGEVEARSVQSRMNLGNAKRLGRYIEQSEDISREFQDVVMGDLGVAQQIIGEQGAQRLTEAGLAVDSINNLTIAKEMETAGKSAKEIWLATGWQKGKDGKWRMEIQDGKLKPRLSYWEIQMETRKLFDEFHGKSANNPERRKAILKEIADIDNYNHKLGDIFNAPELYKAYPQLKDIDVEYVTFTTPDFRQSLTKASFSPEENKIRMSEDMERGEANSAMIHEVQHAIQYIEGFAHGSNRMAVSQSVDFKNKPYVDELNARINYYFKTKEGRSALAEIDKFIADNPDFTGDMVTDFDKKLIKKYPGYLSVVEANNEINKQNKLPVDATEGYKRIAGEVESRNAQKRISFDDARRAMEMLSESEDVAREDQIVLMKSVKSALDLTPKIDQTQTEAFKKWFGKSVVTEDESFGGFADISSLIGTDVVGYRFGFAPSGGKSYNSREQIHERGVSMANVLDIKESTSLATLYAKEDRPIVYYYGEFSGKGSDDEYIMRNVKKISKDEYDNYLSKLNNARNEIIRYEIKNKDELISYYKSNYGWHSMIPLYEEDKLYYEQLLNKESKGNYNTDYGFDDAGNRIRFSLQPPPPGIAEPYTTEDLKPRDMFNTDGKIETKFNHAVENVFDNMLAVKFVEDEVEKREGKFNAHSHPYREENMSRSKAQAEKEKFDNEIVMPYEKVLAEIQQSTGLSYEDIWKYLVAKHAPERNKDLGKGENGVAAGSIDGNLLTDATANWYITQFEDEVSKYDGDLLQKLWAARDKMTRFTLNHYLNSGMISREVYDKLTDTETGWKHYVPYRGWKDGINSLFDYQVGEIGDAYNPFKKADGRVSESDDPTVYMISMGHTAILAGAKNGYKQQMANLILLNPQIADAKDLFWFKRVYRILDDNGDIVDELPQDKLPGMYIERRDNGKITVIGSGVKGNHAKLKAAGGTWDFARRGYTFDANKEEGVRMEFAVKPGTVTTKVTDIHQARKPIYLAQQHEVDVFIRGERAIMVFADPKVAHALNRINAVAQDAVPYAQKYIGTPTRYLAQVLTSKNPAFWPVNMTRDIGYAWAWHAINSEQSAPEFLRNVPVAIKASKRYLSSHTRHLKQKDYGTFNEVDKMYERWRLSGGETSYFRLLDIEKLRTNVDRDMKVLMGELSVAGKMNENVIKKASEWLGIYSQLSENISRFATYLTSYSQYRKRGIEDEEAHKRAVSDSKNVTVNFDKYGRVTPLLKAFYLFIGPNLGGMYNIAKLANKNRAAFAKGTIAFMLLGMASAEITRLLSPPDDDDPTQREYDTLKDFVKENYLVLPNPAWLFDKGKESFITIPMPQGFRALYAGGVIADDVIRGKKTIAQGFGKFAAALADAFMPVSLNFTAMGDKGVTGERLFRPLFPDIAKPFYDTYLLNENYSAYTITRPPFTDRLDERLPEFTEARSYNNPYIVMASKWLNKLGGGDDLRSAAFELQPDGAISHRMLGKLFDINPARMEYLIEQYTGGVGMEFNNLIKTTTSAVQKMTGDEDAVVDTRNIPILRRFYQTASNESAFTKWNELKKEVDDHFYYMNSYKRNEDYEKYKLLRSNTYMYKLKKLVDAVGKRADKIEDVIDWKSQNEESAKQYYEKMEELYRKALQDAIEMKKEN